MSEPVQRFTQDARHVLSLAHEEAEREGLSAIDTKHLLLALLRDKEGFAGPLLRVLGLNADHIKAVGDTFSDRFQWVFNEQRQPLLIADEEGNVLICNEAAQDLIDHHMDELVDTFRGIGGMSESAVGNRLYWAVAVSLSDDRRLVLMLDVTHVRELEREQRFATVTILHDAKTPLSAISHWAEHLRQHTQLDEQSQRIVERISHSADVMMKLVDYGLYDLLNPVDTAWIATHSQPCDFKGMIDTEVEDLQYSASRLSVSIHSDLPTNKFWVSGIEWQLARMIRLLMNIALYGSSQGEKLRVSIAREATNVMLRIQKQGSVYGNLLVISHIFFSRTIQRRVNGLDR